MCEPLKSKPRKLSLFKGFLLIPIFSNLLYFTFFSELLQHLIISSVKHNNNVNLWFTLFMFLALFFAIINYVYTSF